jgi:hypothetical protein
MPVVVLGLSFMLKLFIDRSTTAPDAIVSTLELPVDITFLSISLIVGFTIAPSGDAKAGLAWFAFYMFAAIFIVFLWRRSIKSFDAGGRKTVILLAGANYFLAISALVNSVSLITGGR